jgi:CHRD domain
MRIAILTTTLGTLVLAPAAAQSAKQPPHVQPIAHKSATPTHSSRETLVAVLSGGYAIPAVETPATGTVEITLVASRPRYRVDVDSISDVTGAYLHIGRGNQVTPAVADLFDGVKAGPVSGLLASGTLRAADLHETTMRRLIRALQNNDVYVTVHTRSHPATELRGQLRLQPTMASR